MLVVLLLFLPAIALLSNKLSCESGGFIWLNNSNYPATYSFTDDAVGSTPSGWTASGISSSAYLNVTNFFNGHQKVVKSVDDDSASCPYLYNTFSAQTQGVVELFMFAAGTQKTAQLTIDAGIDGEYQVNVAISSGSFKCYDGAWNTLISSVDTDSWHHVKIYFDTDNDIGYFWFDGVYAGSCGFQTASSGLTRMKFGCSSTAGTGYESYYDAIGYSWSDDYHIGDNLQGGCCGDDIIDLKKGLISWWPLDESSGSTAEDLINDNNGTLTNTPTWTTGKFGNALDFDIDDYVMADYNESLEASDKVSYGAWVKLDAFNSASASWVIGSNAPDNCGYNMVLKNTGVAQCAVMKSDGTWVSIAGGSISTGVWYNVYCVYDRDYLTLYVDGVRVGRASVGSDLYACSADFLIGGTSSASRYYDGLIDEVRVYDRALSDRDIEYLYEMSPYSFINYTDVFTNGTVGVDAYYCANNELIDEVDESNYSCALSGYDYLFNDWLEPSFMYRKNITLSNSGSEILNYQVNINPQIYNTSDLVASYHFSDEQSIIKDYSGSGNYASLYGSTVGLWHFNEGEGTKVYDSSINGGSSTAWSSPTWDEGVFGKAINFDGDDYVTLGDYSGEVISDPSGHDLSFSFWFKKNTADFTTTAYIISSGGQTAGAVGVFCNIWDDETLHCGIATTTRDMRSSSLLTTQQGEWYFVTVSYNDSGDYTDYYVNGKLIETVSSTAISRTDGYTELTLGVPNNNKAAYFFNGVIDELSFYDTALTQDDVNELFYSQRAKFIEYTSGYEGKGNGLKFDGVDDYVSADFDSVSNLTVSAWFKTKDRTANQRIVSKTESAEWQISLNENSACPSSTLCFLVNVGGTYYDTSIPVTDVSNNAWHNVVGVYDGELMRFYFDGDLVDTNSLPSGSITSNSAPLCIGAEATASACSGLYFDGSIDEVLIYNRSLTDREVSDLYNERKGRLDYADLRFFNSSGDELNYYFDYDNSIWVKVPIIPSGDSNITLYYGNPNAISKSDGDSTFDLFDDFNEGMIDSSKWLLAAEGSGGSYWLTDGFVNLKSTDLQTGSANLYSVNDFTNNFTINWVRFNNQENYNDFCFGYGSLVGVSGATDWWHTMPEQSYCNNIQDNLNYLYVVKLSTTDYDTLENNIDGPDSGQWSAYSVFYNSSGGWWWYYYDDGWNSLGTLKSNITYVDDRKYILFSRGGYSGASYGGTSMIDEVFVHKYSLNEPSITIGSSESIYDDSSGLAYYSFDSDVDNLVVDSVGKNDGIIYGSTVGLWHFDENSDSTAYDSTSYDNDGTISGAVWTSDSKSGSALSFDGIDDYISILDDDSLDLSSSFTISTWFKLNGDGTAAKSYWTLINKNPTSYGYNDPFHLFVTSTDYYFNVRVGDGVDYYEISSNINVNDGDWHMGLLIFDDDNDVYKLYLDGELVGSQAVDSSWIPTTNTGDLIIGNWPAYNDFFNGVIDEVAVYNKSLTSDEVSFLYTLTRAQFMEHVSGKIGKAMEFDGIGSYVSINDDSLNLTGNLSISFWAKFNNLGDGNGVLITKGYTGSPSTTPWMFYPSSATQLKFYVANSGNTYASAGFGDDLSNNKWYHFVGVYNGTHLITYEDGSEVSTAELTGPVLSDSGNIFIGYKWGSTFFNGTIDDVRIYDRALTDDEVSALYNYHQSSGCCGDDNNLDNFYNGTLSTTSYICQNGYLNEGLDVNETSCAYYGYDWFTSYLSGSDYYCCGDDSDDYFYNATYTCVSTFCLSDTSYGLDGSLATSDDVCGCDSSGYKCEQTGSFDGTADGICASNDCILNGNLIAYDTSYYSACSVSRECDSSLSSATYSRDGYCAQTSCCTGLMDSGESSSESFTDGDESCSCTDGNICDDDVSSGDPSSAGVCTDTSVCTTSGVVSVNAGDYLAGCSTDNIDCDSDITSPSIGYVKTGSCQGSSCCAEQTGSKLQGEACSLDSQCASYTSGGTYYYDGDCTSSCTCSFTTCDDTNSDSVCDSQQEPDDYQSICIVNNYWIIDPTTGDYPNCCGDDGVADDFYNGTLNTTSYSCYDGVYYNTSLDVNSSACTVWGYDWLTDVNYPATYSFTDDAVGSTTSDFSLATSDVAVAWFNVSDVFLNHRRVINLSWTGDADGYEIWSVPAPDLSSGVYKISWWESNSLLHRNSLGEDTGGGVILSNSDSSEYLSVWHDANNGDVAVIMYNGFDSIGSLDVDSDRWYYYELAIDLDAGVCNLSRDGSVLTDNSGNPIVNFNLPAGFVVSNIGFIIINGDSRDNVYIDALNLSWAGGSDNNFIPSCCGDDGVADDFYNGTIGTTSYSCYDGVYYDESLDVNSSACTAWGYDWMIGTISFDSEQVIQSSFNSARGVALGDLDGDGDNDIVATSNIGDKVSWWANDGSGSFGVEQVIQSSFDGAYAVALGDLDGDGDLDVVATAYDGSKVSWWANDGSGSFGSEQLIQSFASAYAVALGDLDGDGDLDVVATAGAGDKVSWWANDGSGSFGVEQVIQTSFINAHDVALGDLDGDGDLDVVATSYYHGEMSFWLNDGSGSFGLKNIVVSSGPTDIALKDLDLDGDIDIATTEEGYDRVAFWLNNGYPAFSSEQVIQTSFDGSDITLGDLDGDGDNDIVATSIAENKVSAWFNNLLALSGKACCGDDIGEDWVNETLHCCCNAEVINLSDTCDTDEDFIFDSVCGSINYCNSSSNPLINLSSNVLSAGDLLTINISSECQPNLMVIYPNLSEKQLITSSCGADCFNASLTTEDVGYYHLKVFNGLYNYSMFLVKNTSLVWSNPWTDHEGDGFRYRNDIIFNQSLNHSRINQLIEIPFDLSNPAYCEDVNGDGDYNDVVDKLGLRLVNLLPDGELYEVPMSLINVNCSPEHNLTSATLIFSLNLPANGSPFIDEGNTYSLYYGPFDYNVKSYAGINYDDDFNRFVNTSVMKVEYSLTSNVTQTLFNFLGTSIELEGDGDVIISPLEYDDGTTYTFFSDSVNTYGFNASPAVIDYSTSGLMNDDSVSFNQSYHANSYYFTFKTGINFSNSRSINWLKNFELNLNLLKFTNVASPNNVYGVNTSSINFDYNTKWLTLFNNETGDAIALIRVNSSGTTSDPLLTYEVVGNEIIISNYPVHSSVSVNEGDAYTSNYALMVYNYSNHGFDSVNKVWEWLNNNFNYSISSEEVSFDISSYSYDQFVDRSDEQISINASIYSNTQNITAIHAAILNSAGNISFSRDYDCTLSSNHLYDCNFTINPSIFDCDSYTASIYGVGVSGNTTAVNFTFNIDDLIGAYSITNDSLITTDQRLFIIYDYCSGNGGPSNIHLNVTKNDDLILNSNLPLTGEYIINYTNPSTTGLINFTLNASDGNYFDNKNFTANVVKSSFSFNSKRKVYPQGTAGYRGNFLSITNPSSSTQTYNVGLVPIGIIARFSDSKTKAVSITIPAYSTEILFVDVFPVNIGVYQILANVIGGVQADNGTDSFNAVIQTYYSSGVFNYTIVSGFDINSFISLLLIVSLLFYFFKK